MYGEARETGAPSLLLLLPSVEPAGPSEPDVGARLSWISPVVWLKVVPLPRINAVPCFVRDLSGMYGVPAYHVPERSPGEDWNLDLCGGGRLEGKK